MVKWFSFRIRHKKKPRGLAAVRSFNTVRLRFSVSSPTCVQVYVAMRQSLRRTCTCTSWAPIKAVHTQSSLLKRHRRLRSRDYAPPRARAFCHFVAHAPQARWKAHSCIIWKPALSRSRECAVIAKIKSEAWTSSLPSACENVMLLAQILKDSLKFPRHKRERCGEERGMGSTYAAATFAFRQRVSNNKWWRTERTTLFCNNCCS